MGTVYLGHTVPIQLEEQSDDKTRAHVHLIYVSLRAVFKLCGKVLVAFESRFVLVTWEYACYSELILDPLAVPVIVDTPGIVDTPEVVVTPVVVDTRYMAPLAET